MVDKDGLTKKHAGGRPLEYKHEYVDKVYEYLELKNDEEIEFHKTRGENTNSYERIVKVDLPTKEDFALFIGVNKSSLYEWEALSPEFSIALDLITVHQRGKLINGGLSGTYNPTIAKLLLSANHGMKEKNETELSNPDGNLKTIVINKNYGINN